MLAQNLVSLVATNLQNQRKGVKAINAPQVSKGRTYYVHLLVKAFQKDVL